MDRKITWVGFGMESALTKTAVHFFGCSTGVSAPYPAQVILTRFQKEPQAVALDGVRLNQPGGIMLESAFPGEVALCGIALELSTNQTRESLAESQCFFELQSRVDVVRYRPTKVGATARNGVLIRDSKISSSVVVINPTEQAQSCTWKCGEQAITLEPLAPWEVKEIQIQDDWYAKVGKEVTGPRGVIYSMILSVSEPSSLIGYLIHRDSAVRKPVSVRPL